MLGRGVRLDEREEGAQDADEDPGELGGEAVGSVRHRQGVSQGLEGGKKGGLSPKAVQLGLFLSAVGCVRRIGRWGGGGNGQKVAGDGDR